MRGFLFYAIIHAMKPIQYALPSESIVDLAFQYDKVNYNLHVNTETGIIKLEHIETDNTREEVFTQLI